MLKIGVIGAGAFSKYTLSAYRKYLKGAEVTAIASRTKSKAEALAAELGIPNVKDSNDALLSDPDIDIILILTPPQTHFELAMNALNNGKHLLVDKPVVFTVDEVNELTNRAQAKNLEISTNLVLRAHPFHKRIREIQKDGSMGPLLQIISSAMLARYPEDHWYWKPEISGGFYLNTFSHFLDLYDFITDAYPTPMQSSGDPDHGFFLSASYPRGTLSTLAVSLQVSNANERVHTSYIFERGMIETQGWLPERMEIRPENGDLEILDSDAKDTEYQMCLAAIMNDLAARIAAPETPSSVDIDLNVIRSSICIPLQFSDLSNQSGT